MSGAADEILARCRISDVYQALTGADLRRVAPQAYRARAAHRNGDNPDAMSFDDTKNAYYDHVEGVGGGALDLIVLVQGGTRQDALKWLADFVGVPLEDRQFSTAERTEWAREKQTFERDLPDARYWRRAAISLAEETLDREKARLFDPTDEPADLRAIADISGMLSRLRAAGDTLLVDLFREWRDEQPHTTALLVRIARQRELDEVRALCRAFGFPMKAASAYLRSAR